MFSDSSHKYVFRLGDIWTQHIPAMIMDPCPSDILHQQSCRPTGDNLRCIVRAITNLEIQSCDLMTSTMLNFVNCSHYISIYPADTSHLPYTYIPRNVYLLCVWMPLCISNYWMYNYLGYSICTWCDKIQFEDIWSNVPLYFPKIIYMCCTMYYVIGVLSKDEDLNIG